MIGVDWGTSSFRAFRIQGAHVSEKVASVKGALAVPPGGFAQVLGDEIGPWLANGEDRVLMSGMVGSRQGWAEAPYLGCPAGAGELAGALLAVPFADASVAIVPGVQDRDPDGVPEVMRGEETQLVGVIAAIGREDALVCLPGTHSKWATVEGGRISGFRTHMTGEVFAALRGHTILGRTMREAPTDTQAFLRGVTRAGQGGGLLHHLFGVRTLTLFSELPENEAASYLSGLLIGHEIAAAAPARTVHLVGAPSLCALYRAALEQRGVPAVIAPPDVAAVGLAMIAERAGWN